MVCKQNDCVNAACTCSICGMGLIYLMHDIYLSSAGVSGDTGGGVGLHDWFKALSSNMSSSLTKLIYSL